jgi:hypothetical protein
LRIPWANALKRYILAGNLKVEVIGKMAQRVEKQPGHIFS